MAVENQRKLFFKNLLAALQIASKNNVSKEDNVSNEEDNVLEDTNENKDAKGNNNNTYAAGGKITPNQQGFVLESLHVEGAGELRLPLSLDNSEKLLGVCEQAPYGHGLATVVDTIVRRAWQVDASKVTFPKCPNFISKTVQQIANKAVEALGLDGPTLQLEPHLYKLLFYESDGHFSLHRDTEKEPGMFATLVLQLPTEEGFEGGALVVRHGGTTKTFNFAMDSTTGFFYTVFYADCEHVLERITSGKRLCLSFNLVRSNKSFNIHPEELKRLSSRLAKVEEVLQPWMEAVTRLEPCKEKGKDNCEDKDDEEENNEDKDKDDEDNEAEDNFVPEKLAIPLEHRYTKKNLSFSGLKGNDRIIAGILESCRDGLGEQWLDLHLCIMTKYQIGLDMDSANFSKTREYESDDTDADILRLDDDDFAGGIDCVEVRDPNNWIGMDNKRCSFALKIDQELEIVIDDDIQEEPFEDEKEPDELKHNPYTGNEGPSVEYWYHKAMLVVWPKKKSISMACTGGVSDVVDVLESKVAERNPNVTIMLHDVLTYCESNDISIWHKHHKVEDVDEDGDGDEDDTEKHKVVVPYRLMKLCLEVGGLEDVVRVLKLLAKPFKHGYRRDSKTFTIGINNANTATKIANAVQKHGWTNCGSFILEILLKDQLAVQGRFFAQLALELQKLGCGDAGLLVANKTLELIYNTCSSLSKLEVEMVVNVGKMIFSFKRCMEEFGLKFVERLVELNTDMICSVVIHVYATFSEEIVDEALSTKEDGVSCVFLFKKMCEVITTWNFHRPAILQSQSHIVVDLVRTFVMLGNEQFFNKLIEIILDQLRVYKEQHLLKELLDSDVVWTDLLSTAIGREKLQVLAEERIQVLVQPEPPFTWCMPFARFPRHPVVEAFLRGPDESFTYNNSSNYYDCAGYASRFARKYFNGKYKDGYSAHGTPVHVNEIDSYVKCCEIKKTDAAFKHDLGHWTTEQWMELSVLRSKLERLLGAGKRGCGSRERIVEDVVSFHEKKRKLDETKHIDVLLDNVE